MLRASLLDRHVYHRILRRAIFFSHLLPRLRLSENGTNTLSIFTGFVVT